jgi:branched-chain amino acid transport system permease protein
MNYFLHLIVLMELYLILSLSLNLMVGYTGLLTLAHAAFYGIGAYVCTLLMVDLGWPFLPSLALAIGGAFVLSMLISLSSLRFRGDYFILMTLAFQVIVFTILYNWVGVTRGPFGVPGIPKPSIFGLTIDSLASFSVFGFLCAALVAGFLTVVFRSPFGRALQAIRDDELAATALGKKHLSFKLRSVAIASSCAAVAGALYATYVTFIDPTSFTLDESILMLSMVIVGGTGNVRGPIVGALILVLLPEVLRFMAIPDSVAANTRLIIYGLLLILMMRFRPQGIAGRYQFE